MLLYGPVQLTVRPVGGGQVQLRVDAELAVPLRAERLGQEVGVARCRARPLHAVLQAQLFGGLKDLQRLGRREVQHHPAVLPGRLDRPQRDRVRVLDRHVVLQRLRRDPLGLGDQQEAAFDVAGAGHIGLVEHQLLHALADQVLGGAVHAVARAHVHRCAVGRGVALGRDAGVDDVEPLLLVVAVVDRALDDAGVAHDAEHLVAFHELLGQRRHLPRVGLLGLDEVLDGPAVDASVVVDAIEERLGHVRDIGEVGTRLLGRDGAELDRLAGRLLTGAGAALGSRLRLRAGTWALVRVAGGERSRSHEHKCEPRDRAVATHSPSSLHRNRSAARTARSVYIAPSGGGVQPAAGHGPACPAGPNGTFLVSLVAGVRLPHR